MGSTGNLVDDDERPVTRVRIRSAFWMGKYEVMQQQWRAVMRTNPSGFENCGPDCPVESVSWDYVQSFVRGLNAMEGRSQYRLPTEAEWEYAARAGTSTDTPAGNLQIQGERNASIWMEARGMEEIAESTMPGRRIAWTGRRSSTRRTRAAPTRSGRRCPMLSVCMTCWGTYGSGWKISTGSTLVDH